ncbi:hypothetical protein [Bradyrhizobium glycinis]|uniref:hypothetical protein n=1 Tax=Bradyrhizobium glycinis TaxID=2751812 RepID=UPI00289C0F4C|nr:hypothetical protein [Bradyrhizobium glycinis]
MAAQFAKKPMQAPYETSLSAGLAIDGRAIPYPFITDDQKEGMAAFVEKLQPIARDGSQGIS